MARGRHVTLVGALLIALAVLCLAACAASSASPGAGATLTAATPTATRGGSIPAIVGIWTGTFTLSSQPSGGDQTHMALQVQQGADGQLSGEATMCGGIYGDKKGKYAVNGTITSAPLVHLDFVPSGGGTSFHVEGPYSASGMTLSGATGGGLPTEYVNLTLTPASSSDFAATCA
jgi:hypothetical protein